MIQQENKRSQSLSYFMEGRNILRVLREASVTSVLLTTDKESI
jgi:hypothetical protein